MLVINVQKFTGERSMQSKPKREEENDPTQKDYNPAQALQKSWENFKLELDKCDLLCANCHRLVHHTYESNWGSDWVDDGV
jgi:hypothetical protein